MAIPMTENRLARQYARGHDDRRAANAFGHSDESLAFAAGVDRRQAKDAYARGWDHQGF